MSTTSNSPVEMRRESYLRDRHGPVGGGTRESHASPCERPHREEERSLCRRGRTAPAFSEASRIALHDLRPGARKVKMNSRAGRSHRPGLAPASTATTPSDRSRCRPCSPCPLPVRLAVQHEPVEKQPWEAHLQTASRTTDRGVHRDRDRRLRGTVETAGDGALDRDTRDIRAVQRDGGSH